MREVKVTEMIFPVTIKELEHAIKYIEGFIHENNSQYDFWMDKKQDFVVKLDELKQTTSEA